MFFSFHQNPTHHFRHADQNFPEPCLCNFLVPCILTVDMDASSALILYHLSCLLIELLIKLKISGAKLWLLTKHISCLVLGKHAAQIPGSNLYYETQKPRVTEALMSSPPVASIQCTKERKLGSCLESEPATVRRSFLG